MMMMILQLGENVGARHGSGTPCEDRHEIQIYSILWTKGDMKFIGILRHFRLTVTRRDKRSCQSHVDSVTLVPT